MNTLVPKGLSLLILVGVNNPTWANDSATNAPPAGAAQLDFGVFWPPIDPTAALAPGTEPLLNGRVVLRPEAMSSNEWVLRLQMSINRLSSEDARERWNARLAFPEYDWMRYVRVWDAEKHWLWPNLPYLLRLHGVERIERYGGVDPGKGVDNDFAAILVRKFGANGREESEDTVNSPLVSAEWYPVGANGTDKNTIIHTAKSDRFTLRLGDNRKQQRGQARVWLIYADFMGARLPDSWPKELEFAGGILAYFQVIWELEPGVGCTVTIQQTVPNHSTGFDWQRWTARTLATANSQSTAKLSD